MGKSASYPVLRGGSILQEDKEPQSDDTRRIVASAGPAALAAKGGPTGARFSICRGGGVAEGRGASVARSATGPVTSSAGARR